MNQKPGRSKYFGVFFCALVLAVLVSAVHFRSLYRDARSFSLQVSMSSSVPGRTQFYYDTGEGLTERESVKATVEGDGEFHIYNLPLPLVTIESLRFDPLQTGGAVSVKGISIVNGFGKSVSSIDLDTLRPAHQIRTFRIQDNVLNITIEEGAKDPQIFIPLYSPLQLDTFKHFHILPVVRRLAGGMLVSFFSAFLLFWILRRQGIMTGFFYDPAETSINWMKENKIFFGVLLCIFTFRIFFVLTYPLDTCSDQGTYYKMMRHGYSTLIHATGYPYFMHFFSAGLPTKTHVLLFQHLTDFGVQLVLMVVLKKRFGLIAAVVAGLVYGLELRSINWVSRSTPEWLQGAFLAVAFVGAIEAHFAERSARKIVLYLLSAWAFAWTILMKFLTFVLLPIYPILFLTEKRSWKGKWVCFSAMGIIFFVQMYAFIYFYHYPSTGTKALTSITGWTLDRKMSYFLPKAHHLSESGPWSKRYCILVSEMPLGLPDGVPEITIYALFGHIDSVPAWIREPYRERYRELLKKEESELQSIINTKQNVRGLDSFFLAYYFLGLPETDRLLEKVFLETVIRYPKEYLLQVLKGVKDSFFIETSYYIAVIGNPRSDHPFQVNENDISQNLSWGYARYNVSKAIRCMYDDPIFLKPGLHFFSVWGEWVNIPVIIKWIFVFLGTVFAFIAYRRDKSSKSHILYLSFGVMVLFLLIVEANMIWALRDKEFEACQHLFSVLIGVSASSIMAFRRLTGSKEKQSNEESFESNRSLTN